MKILLIEDNRAISKGLVYTLEQNGFEMPNQPLTLSAVTLTFLLLMCRFPTATVLNFVTR